VVCGCDCGREGEVDGKDYHFTTVEAMKDKIAAGDFIEWAEVHGRYYGTSFRAVESVRELNKLCVLDIDVQGCRSVRKAGIPACFVFISPPSFEALENRLRSRGTETEEAIQRRLANSKSEMDARSEPGLFDHEIVNDNLDTAFGELRALFEAELENANLLQAASA